VPLKPGLQLGQYRIEKRLGAGGMGEVYLATDTELKRLVAIKTLLPMHANDSELVRRFEMEAQAVAQLNHPNIVQIFNVNVHADPIYMAMEYVDGLPLDLYVKQEGKLSWQMALSIGSQVAAALACTHARGIIHRDIKPANILLDRNMGVHVTDFGIAKVLNANTNLTATDAAIGSPCYMSPEHCGIGDIVPASDIFSLGVTLYEAMTGELPFKAETALGVMNKITSDPTPPVSALVSDLPPIVPLVLESMMGKKLEDRYSSASQIIEDLRAFRDGKTPTHLSAIRMKRAGSDEEVFEVVVPGRDIIKASQGQSLVSELMTGQDYTVVPARVIHKPDRQWPMLIAKGVIVLAGIFVVVGLVSGAINMAMQDKEPPPVAPPPPPNQAQEGSPLDGQARGEERLPIGPDGEPGLPYASWKPGDPLGPDWSPPPGGPEPRRDRLQGQGDRRPPNGGLRRPPPRPPQQ
jgi:serine/threonine protein kinase